MNTSKLSNSDKTLLDIMHRRNGQAFMMPSRVIFGMLTRLQAIGYVYSERNKFNQLEWFLTDEQTRHNAT